MYNKFQAVINEYLYSYDFNIVYLFLFDSISFLPSQYALLLISKNNCSYSILHLYV